MNSNINFPLLELPDLVLDIVYSYLDTRTLLYLRRVSKYTNYLVEKPANIKRIPVRINSPKRFEKVLNSSTPWTNFYFKWSRKLPPAGREEEFSAFFQRFGPTLIKFEAGSYLTLLEFSELLQLPKLEVFITSSHFKSMDKDSFHHARMNSFVTSDGFKTSKFEGPISDSKNLKILQISAEPFIQDVLLRTPNLQRLMIFSQARSQHHYLETEIRDNFIGVMSSYVQTRFTNRNRSKDLTIQFGSWKVAGSKRTKDFSKLCTTYGVRFDLVGSRVIT